MKAICLVFVNRKFVDASSKINVGYNHKFLSFESVLLNLCCIPYLKKLPFVDISVPFLVGCSADSASGSGEELGPQLHLHPLHLYPLHLVLLLLLLNILLVLLLHLFGR